MKIKRFAAALCALAVVAASTGGLPIDKVGLFDTTITASAETIGTWTSGSCTLTLDDAGTLTVSGNGAMDNYTDEYGDKSVPWKDVRDSVTSVVISDGVTEIGDYAFLNFDNLTSLSIADTVTNIGDSAFSNCGSLNTITIPSSITSIGLYAFYSSTAGRIVTFIRPESESSLTVANGAFYYSAKLFYSDGGKYSLFEGDTEMELTGEISKGDKLNGKTLTWKLPIFSITDNSVNGSVTASVGGTDVTKAEEGNTVMLTVTPASGYQFKSITASSPKDNPENFSDLVSLMGTAEFAGQYSCTGYTCKVVNGKFVVYNGTTLVTEAAASNVTDFSVSAGWGDNISCSFSCGDVVWGFTVSDGKITDISADYYNLFDGTGESNGTLSPTEIALTTVTTGSKYSFTMPKKSITVKAEFEESDGGTESGQTTVEYDVQAVYTVTIPAGVTLSDTATASRTITASDVVLADGKKIKVTLDSATHTESGSTFHAMNSKGDSTATYTIGKGSADSGISVGGVVAEFGKEGGEQTLTFSKVSGATYAGTHTEVLTFGVSVE